MTKLKWSFAGAKKPLMAPNKDSTAAFVTLLSLLSSPRACRSRIGGIGIGIGMQVSLLPFLSELVFELESHFGKSVLASEGLAKEGTLV